MASKRITRLLKDYTVLTIACIIFAVAWECFMIPNGMSAGGMMGLATVVQYATGGLIKAQYSYFAINSILIIIAVMAMGIGFGFKTIFSIAVSSLAMQLLDGVTVLQSVPGQFLYVEETILVPIIAGIFESVGIGLVLRYGGSTGGTDIIALMVNKYWPISLSTVFLISDVVICGLLLLLPEKNFSDMCYGLTEVFTFSMIIDIVVGGRKTSYQLMVFSEKFQDIADHIMIELERGVTVLHAQGWYTKKEKDVLYILVSQKELSSLTKTIKEIDSRAFMSISPTNNVYGEGFEDIKAGLTKKKHS